MPDSSVGLVSSVRSFVLIRSFISYLSYLLYDMFGITCPQNKESKFRPLFVPLERGMEFDQTDGTMSCSVSMVNYV